MTPDPMPLVPDDAAGPPGPPLGDDAPPALAQALARLRADLQSRHAPAPLWPRVAAACPAPPGRGHRRAEVRAAPAIASLRWAGGAAALLAVALVWWAGPTTTGSTATDGETPAGRASGFVAVASPERFAELWQGGAESAPAWVVRTDLPRERLAALGLPYDPARAGERVRAELLLHPSGDVLAVRLTR